MKKTYIIPEVNITVLQFREQILQPSVTVNTNAAGIDGSDVEVKGNHTDTYNVWNDDWSK